jgi:hypothetical protein
MDGRGALLKIARVFSAAGHPFITVPLFVIVVSANTYSPPAALYISTVLIGFVVVPVLAWNVWHTRRGAYTNIDVSDGRQRRSMYLVILLLLAAAVIPMSGTGQPHGFIRGTLFALALLVTCALINLVLKCSLHAALSFFLAIAALVINPVAGAAMLLFAIPVSLSRIVLGRHTAIEVLTGALVGIAFGIALLLTVF